MERGCSAVVCLFMIFTTIHLWAPIHALNVEGNVLLAFKNVLTDPTNALQSWDPSSDSPCSSWLHVDCSDSNTVQGLYLANYDLAGPLVPDLQNLTELQYLELFDNQIYGSIPKEFGNLANLVALDLYNNSLIGSIPVELGKLSKLKFLRLYDNKLEGEVPDEVKNLPDIKLINASSNPNMCGEYTDNPSCP